MNKDDDINEVYNEFRDIIRTPNEYTFITPRILKLKQTKEFGDNEIIIDLSKIDKDMFQKMYVDLDVDYEDFDNIDEEEAVKVKAKNLPEGWYWIKYYDGSGNLQAPDGKEYMIYDLSSDEYLFSYESDIWNSIREGYEIPKKDLNPFEIMEKEMLDYYKDLLVTEVLNNGYEI